MCYDQTDACNLAGVELVVRANRGETHKYKMAADEMGESSLFMGVSGGAGVGQWSHRSG